VAQLWLIGLTVLAVAMTKAEAINTNNAMKDVMTEERGEKTTLATTGRVLKSGCKVTLLNSNAPRREIITPGNTLENGAHRAWLKDKTAARHQGRRDAGFLADLCRQV
jgi:uncharacterized protein YaaQ